MKFTPEGIEATHDEMVEWLKWFCGRMQDNQASPAAVREFGHNAAQWLATGANYVHGTQGDLCDLCEGTGQSKLRMMSNNGLKATGRVIPCSACGGTGRKKESVQ